MSVFFENSAIMKAGPRQTQFQASEDKTVKFSDVHGVDEAKEVTFEDFQYLKAICSIYIQELQDVVAFLKDPSAFSTLGGKLPKGVLLTGSVAS